MTYDGIPRSVFFFLQFEGRVLLQQRIEEMEDALWKFPHFKIYLDQEVIQKACEHFQAATHLDLPKNRFQKMDCKKTILKNRVVVPITAEIKKREFRRFPRTFFPPSGNFELQWFEWPELEAHKQVSADHKQLIRHLWE